MAESYDSWTPYQYVRNNPIRRIDPNGMYDDEYGVDDDGKVTFLKEKEGPDELYKTDKDGNKVDVNGDGKMEEGTDYVTVDDETILPSLSEVKEERKDSYHGDLTLRTATVGEGSQDDIFKVFLFAANNTNAEWGAFRANVNGTETFGIGTYQCPTLSPGAGQFGLTSSQLTSRIHSHPRPGRSEEVGSMYGDQMQAWGYTNKGESIPYNNYVYMPKSGNLWSLNRKTAEPQYIRPINGNYKRLFFGTLNTR